MEKTLLAALLILLAFGALAQDIYKTPKGQQSRVSSLENLNGLKGQGGKTNGGAKGNAFSNLKSGEIKTLLDINKAGIIQRTWFTIDDRNPEMLRGLRLKMFWDGSTEPAVDVPFGDFFCAGLKPVAFESALFSNPEGRSFNCYIPMPFRSGAKITLTNTTKKDLELLFFDIDFIANPHPAADDMYFHAAFNHQKYPVGESVNILPLVKGKGRFLGMSAAVKVDAIYEHTWWGEGEVKMYIDGDTEHPTINGTGAEDYIGTGWFEGPFAHQYQGCLVADPKNYQYAFYRFHIPDAIYFYHDFKATIQQIGGWYAEDVKALQAKGVPLDPISLYQKGNFRGLKDHPEALNNADTKDWMNFYRSDDYAVTAYYYLDKP